MNFVCGSLNEQGVTKGELFVFEAFLQVLAAAVDGEDDDTKALAELKFLEAFTGHGGLGSDDAFHEQGSFSAQAFESPAGFASDIDAFGFGNAYHALKSSLENDLITWLKSNFVEGLLDPAIFT